MEIFIGSMLVFGIGVVLIGLIHSIARNRSHKLTAKVMLFVRSFCYRLFCQSLHTVFFMANFESHGFLPGLGALIAGLFAAGINLILSVILNYMYWRYHSVSTRILLPILFMSASVFIQLLVSVSLEK